MAVARVGCADLSALNKAVSEDQFKLYFVHVMETRLRVLERMWETRCGAADALDPNDGGPNEA